MKKIGFFLTLIIVSGSICFLGFGYKQTSNPHTYYKVYLNNEVLGMIKSREQLENYIDEQSDRYKKKYGVSTVYAPTGLETEKVTTYNTKITKVEDIYKMIEEKEPFTVEGYRFSIKNPTLVFEGSEEGPKEPELIRLYVLDSKLFDQAVESLYKTFVGTENYVAYQQGTQAKITSTGVLIENIYLSDDISYKKVKIPVTETIYTEVTDLSKYLLFGTTEDQKKYTVKVGDNIEKVALENKISVEEFLISNPTFSNSKNLLFPGQEVVIGVMDPKVTVNVDQYTVEDIVSKYKTDIRYDANRIQGDDEVTQKGEDGLNRVTQRIHYVNGASSYITPVNIEELKPSINEILIKGEKIIPSVGSTKNWLWPTDSGWRITSNYGYRLFNGRHELHAALDIAGLKMGSPIYAVTNGVVQESRYRWPDGNYVCINHNNGYWTCYNHMSKQAVKEGQIVERGQVIGYIGMTGETTGPHVHFEVWRGNRPWNSGSYRINPWTMYP